MGVTLSRRSPQIPLIKPVEFMLHHKPFTKVRKRKCVYWDFKNSSWSQDGCYIIKKESTATTTACQCYHLTNFALSVEEEEDIPETTENTNDANKQSWDTFAYFSAEPSVTPGPEYLEQVVEEDEHRIETTTEKQSIESSFFIVSAPPRILRMESLIKSKKETESSTHSQHHEVDFIEVVEQPIDSDQASNSVKEENFVNDYENFWASDEFDDTLQLEQQTLRPKFNHSEFNEFTEHLGDIMTDPDSNASKILTNGYEEFLEDKDIDYLQIEDKDTDVEYFSEFGSFDLIDQSEKSQPLTILKEEFTINEITAPDVAKNDPKVTKEEFTINEITTPDVAKND